MVYIKSSIASMIFIALILTNTTFAESTFQDKREIYGVNKITKRMNDIYSPCALQALADKANAKIKVPECKNGSKTKFNLVAVSGTLEEGFPLRKNLDFNEGDETVAAIFVGKALIRGLKAYLDIKNPESREFKSKDAGFNPINPGMVATGEWNDANIYSVYAVDRRQAINALLNEPRYLSMTPDLAYVDLDAKETSDSLKRIILQQIRNDNNDNNPNNDTANTELVTLLTVVSTWKSCYFVPSPILYEKKDGTRITDFPNSLASFAGVTDELRLKNPEAYNAAIETAVRRSIKTTCSNY